MPKNLEKTDEKKGIKDGISDFARLRNAAIDAAWQQLGCSNVEDSATSDFVIEKWLRLALTYCDQLSRLRMVLSDDELRKQLSL